MLFHTSFYINLTNPFLYLKYLGRALMLALLLFLIQNNGIKSHAWAKVLFHCRTQAVCNTFLYTFGIIFILKNWLLFANYGNWIRFLKRWRCQIFANKLYYAMLRESWFELIFIYGCTICLHLFNLELLKVHWCSITSNVLFVEISVFLCIEFRTVVLFAIDTGSVSF